MLFLQPGFRIGWARRKRNLLAAATYRRQQPRQRLGLQDQVGLCGRFFQRFEQRVGGVRIHPVRLHQVRDLARGCQWSGDRPGCELAQIIHFDLHPIRRQPERLRVNTLGAERPRFFEQHGADLANQRLAPPAARPGHQQRVRHASARQRVFELTQRC